MSLLDRVRNFVEDPPPEFVFELSETGIAWARAGSPAPAMGFAPLPPGVLSVSPVRDNIERADALRTSLAAIVGPAPNRKRRRAAVILPDFAARVSVLDFDSFPGDPQQQASLVRFRVKKSVPFDVDSAAVSFRAQPADGKRVEVVAAVIALEIVGRYEAPFRELNLHAGYITTSLLAALDLVKPGGVTLVAKRTGRVLSVAVVQGSLVRLVRTVELHGAAGAEEALGVLFPTFAYIEDELKQRPDRLLASGFGPNAEEIRGACEAELGVAVEPLRSRLGAPDETNAGLLGYLENTRGS
jgi:type IV pilus assembly protein PilM